MADSKDLLQRLTRVGARIDPGLTDRDVERLVRGAHGRRRRANRMRLALGAAAFAGASAAMIGVRVARPTEPGGHAVASTEAAGAAPRGPASSEPAPSESAPVRAAGIRPVRLDDGSIATPLDSQSELKVIDDSPLHAVLDLARGGARFEVARRPERSFSVRAGGVTVTVIGTVFTVERIADRVGVSVERGTVQVDWGVGKQRLHEGESGWFPPVVVGTRARIAGGDARASTAGANTREPVEESTAQGLLAAADAAREAGQAERGAALLRRLLREHRSDPRAPLAAFTLGRMLLVELDRPREAAAAFAQARALSPAGPFSEDALAREVEAWKKAGEPAEARARALEYLRLYPNGDRAPAVKTFGGIE